jgi:hypothetical protein
VSDPPTKIFDLAEANQALAQVAPIVSQLQGLMRSIAETASQLDEAAGKLAHGNGYPLQEIRQEIERLTKHQLDLVEAFQSAFKQLEGLGCVLKDLHQGLVDFYAMGEGELVFLCWRQGEEHIRFWHDLESGFTGRQPLD